MKFTIKITKKQKYNLQFFHNGFIQNEDLQTNKCQAKENGMLHHAPAHEYALITHRCQYMNLTHVISICKMSHLSEFLHYPYLRVA